MKKNIMLALLAIVATVMQAQTQNVMVVEYCPAPGQFVNLLPEADASTSKEEVMRRCEENLSKSGYPVHLGTYGGYITVKFDHPVENKPGSDLLITGNGMYAVSDPVYGKETIGGSIEPGIVFVGVGDTPETAEWYELAGSEYFSSEVHDFSITYYKPTAESGDHSIKGSIYDDYIRWSCNWTDKEGMRRDSIGYHPKLAVHRQTYWPAWESADKLTFSGGKLPNNARLYEVNGADYWVQYRYSADAYGYVDACPVRDSLYSSFDIDWAVDAQGRRVALDHVDYVRVATGIFQYCGLIGETSTEVDTFADLHLIDGYDSNPYMITPRKNPNDATTIRVPHAESKNQLTDKYFNLAGQQVKTLEKGRIYIHNGKKIMY